MSHINIYYSATLMAAGTACLVVAVMIWSLRRLATGALPLVVVLLALSWWDITYSIFWIGLPGPTPYFWLDLTLGGAFITPTAILVFSIHHARLQRWLSGPILYILFIEPFAALILLWTDPWHNLYFAGKRALNTTMIRDVGVVHWANIYYSYALMLISVVILCVVAYRSVGIYRRQNLLILAGLFVPWLIHISFLSTGGLLPNADSTPFIFSITAVAIAFAVIRYRLMDIVPIARTVLIESMSEGVVVLDHRNRVVDINPAALGVTKLSAAEAIGEPVEKVFSNWKDMVSRYQDVKQARVEVELEKAYLDLSLAPLRDRHGQYVGRLLVWRDITDLKIVQAELEKLATTDHLTQVMNRRSFLEKAQVELSRARRLHHPLAIVLLDMDHFKQINDTYGHPCGDRVLIEFSKACTENIREFDVFARFGGEEFILLMPEADLHHALQVSERLRLSIAERSIPCDEGNISITASLGIAALDGEQDTLEQMILRADQALYRAKQAGRNQSVIWEKCLEPGTHASPGSDSPSHQTGRTG